VSLLGRARTQASGRAHPSGGQRSSRWRSDSNYDPAWRGWGSSGESGSGDIREHETLENLTRDVLIVVLPDDDECAENHP
jgi:hypothetical protein